MPARPNTSLVDHPGSFILEELEARGWSQVDLAYILGLAPQQLNPILTGNRAITPEMAVALGDAFDVPAEFFANLQKLYDLQRAKPADPGVKTRATWQSVYPVRDMIKRGWIEETDAPLLDLQMLRFFECDKLSKVPFVGSEAEEFAFAAKKTDYTETTAVQLAWLYRVKKIAQTMSAPLYSEEKLRASLPTIRAHMIDPEDIAKIPAILNNCGVRFALVEALPRSKIDGVCLWLNTQPVIGMTTRLDRLDNFCFVLRHEIEHVLEGDGRDNPLQFNPVDEFDAEMDIDSSDLPPEEVHANKEAANFCVQQEQIMKFIARKAPFISERDVLGFAARMEIHPAVIVGQIQHKTKKWGWLRKYQVSARKHLMDWKYVDGWGTTAATVL